MSDTEPKPTSGFQELKDAIHRVGEAVGEITVSPELNGKIFESILHILQDHDRRLRVFETAFQSASAASRRTP